MIVSPIFSGKRYAVLGLARSGLATARALLASGADVIAWDDRPEARASLAGAEILNLAEQDLSALQLDALILSPGIPLDTHAVAKAARVAGLPIIGDIELFARARASLPRHHVVGITGTNGKSTTTALIHHILDRAKMSVTLGGNIGLPILGQDPLPAGGVYVLELSSFQLDLTYSLAVDVGVLLNITPDHLDRHGTVEHYAKAKQRLFDMQGPSGSAVIMLDDEPSRAIAAGVHSQLIKVSIGARDLQGVRIIDGVASIDGRVLSAQKDWPALQGPHNAQNAVAAIAACRALAIHDDVIVAGLKTYPGLPHRMERVAERDGIIFINDSKATNPTSSAPALGAFPAIHWIVGGMPKSDDLDACAPYLGNVKAAYTIGSAGPLFAGLLRDKVPSVVEAGDIESAVRAAVAASQPGDVVLLSPACASYDQFTDFEARGRAFADAVGRVADERVAG